MQAALNVHSCFGLLGDIPPSWRDVKIGGHPVVEGYRAVLACGPAQKLVFAMAALYGRCRLLSDLISVWRQLRHGTVREPWPIHVCTYPAWEVESTRWVISLARRAKIISHTRVRMPADHWQVRRLVTEESQRFFEGGWLENFALLAASRMAQRFGADPPMGLVKLGENPARLVGELDVVMRLPNGKWAFVEAKMDPKAVPEGSFLELADQAGVPAKYRIALIPEDRLSNQLDYVMVGPRGYLSYLRELYGRIPG